MNSNFLYVPFLWPDSRQAAGAKGPQPNWDHFFTDSELILGVVNRLTTAGITRLRGLFVSDSSASSNGEAPAEKKVRLIVTLYPTCPTRAETLRELFQLQHEYKSLEVRLFTCNLLSEPQNTLACYSKVDSLPTVLFGSSADFEAITPELAHLTMAFCPDPVLAAEWTKWFDLRWLKAARLTEWRTHVPHMVLPKGTLEATQQWEAFEAACNPDKEEEGRVEVTVDPVTGEVTATGDDGKPVVTVSTNNKLPKISPVYRKLADLFGKGHLVSVDKATRLLPLEVSVKPKWFGLETLKQIGSVRRQVSYHISALTKDELKQLENRRTKTSQLLEVFSFSLADGQRWMPSAAEELFRRENERINNEAKDILSKLIAGNLNTFMKSRRRAVSDDANRMYRDLFPNKELSEDAIDEMMAALKKRFEDAENCSFLPQLSFNRVSLPQPQETDWKSQLGSALHLLLSITRYPRKACKNGLYFGRGMTTKPREILRAMNLFADPFVEEFEKPDAKEKAEVELGNIDAIVDSEVSAEVKCQQLFQLLGHAIPHLASLEDNSQVNSEVDQSSMSVNGQGEKRHF